MGEWRGKTESTGEATKRGILQKEFSHIVRISARFPTISTGEGGWGVICLIKFQLRTRDDGIEEAVEMHAALWTV